MAIDWEYYKKKAKKIDEENYRKNISNDIAPVRTQTPNSNANKTTEPKWYDNFLQLGNALSDGWQFGDITKTLLGTNTDIATNLLSGIVGWGEEAIKAGATAAGTVTEKLGMDDTTEKIREFVSTDLYDANTVSKQILSSNFIGNVPGLSGLGNAIKTIFTLEDFLNSKKEDNSIFADDTDALLQSAGETGAKIGISALSGGLPISDIITGITVYGSQAEQTIKEDATFSKATGSGLISAAAEILFEKLSGGIKFGGVTLDDGLTRIVSKNISNVALKNGIHFFKDFTGEALEEVLTEFVSKLGTSLYKEEDLTNILFSEDALQDYIKAGFSGGLMGGVFNAPNALKGTANGVDYKTGLTNTEQAVFDKVYNDRINEAENGNKKLSSKDKSNIFNSVMNDLERGRIGIDTIESVLGGDTYKQYQSAVEKDNQMKELQKEYDSLYRMKNGEKSDEQIDRQKALKEQLEEYKNTSKLSDIQKQLSSEVSKLAKSNKLVESYNEKSRRSQTFVADLTQYDKKHQGTYKRAMESGILNNTNRTHEFVDLLAKLEADKGVLFDFTNNAKIKETGFAIEGKQVNGYVQGNNIAINIDSTSALNKVVGHEISHVLEGTELYNELANAVKEFATAKGEYDSKLQSIAEIYEGMENVNLENELTAELIGEYLFTDTDFINRLSAEKPTLFQKIFDEIKYLCKVATAGSKEAKQLEKVKKTFEKAYRQKNNTATDDGVKYSLNKNFNNQFDSWDKKTIGFSFVVGKTSDALIKAGIPNQQIRWDASKIKTTIEKHNGMSPNVIKQVPHLLENPIVVIDSKSDTQSKIVMGELYDDNGKIVTAVLKLNPTSKKGNQLDLIKISSTQGRGHVESLFKYKDGKSVAVRYVDEKRIQSWLNVNRLQLPLHSFNLDSNNSVPQDSTTVNNNSMQEKRKNSLSNANEDIAPVGNNVYGEDIKLQPASAEDIAPIGENVVRKTTESENTIIDGDEPIQEIQSMEKTKSTTHEDLVKQMSDIMDEATENDGEENLPDYFVDGQNKRETKSKRKTLHANIIAGFKSKFNEQGFDLDETLKNGKRHSALFNNDNTPQRVLEKTFGYKAGRILSDLTVNKLAQNETEGIKWLNTITGKKGLLRALSKEYNIKPGSKESAAAQMYLEGFYVNESDEYVRYGDTELAADFPDRSVRENIRLLAKDPRVREFYDNSLNAINESRVRNAYDPIPRRDNYALHFRAMEDVFSKIGVPLNPNDIKAKDLPTDLNGVTVDLKPGQPYFASAKHRTGIKTTYDLLGGMERYANSAKNQIYHIDDIQNLRALRNYIADTFGQAKGLEGIDEMTADAAKKRIEQVYNGHLSNFAVWLNEEANHIAGKTALIDRAVEGMFDRRAIQFLSKLNGMVGSNQVGFNISSSLTNILPVIQTFAKSNKYDLTKAFSQMITNKAKSINGNDDGFAEKSPVMIRRKGAESFARTPYQKVADVGYVFMSAVDNVATELIARTKFNEYTRKGMDEQKAHIETDKWVSKLMGDRSLGQQPLLYNSKTLGLFTKYQLEVRNQLDSMFYDTIQEAKEKYENIESNLEKNAKTAAKYTATLFELAVAQHIFGSAFESVAGYNPAFDIIDVILTACGYDDEEDSEDDVLDNLEQAFLELLGDLPYSNLYTGGGRLPIESALPIKEFINGEDQYGKEKSRLETLSEALPYFILPTGLGQIKKSAQGLSMFNDVRELVPEPIREATSNVRYNLAIAKNNSNSEVGKKILDELTNLVPDFNDFPIAGSYTDSGKLRFKVEETPGNIAQAAVFGQYASKTARQYFDEEHAPLSDKQTKELVDIQASMEEYWEYQKGLKKLGEDATLAEKIDYIADLEEFDTWQKNIMANNLTDRKTPIDLTGYEAIGDFEEFDYSMKNPEKYAISKAVGGYDNYIKYSEHLGNITAEKDKNGNSVSGSRKKKVARYINNLDIEFGEKMILYRSQYKSDDTYNAQIVEYLNERNDITRQDKITILTELGFKVLSDGTVKW